MESTVLSEISQSEKQVPYDFTYMWDLMNKELTNKIETDSWTRELTDSYQRGSGLRGWVKRQFHFYF